MSDRSPSSESSPLTFEAAQRRVDDWIQAVGVRYFGELTNLAQLTEEVGELARLLSRTYGEQSFKTSEQPEDVKAAIADELADIVFVTLCLSNQIGIDLTAAFERNLQKKTVRDADRHRSNRKLIDESP